MAQIELPYGETTVSMEVPDCHLSGVLEGKETPDAALEEAFESGWERPFGMDDPAALFHPGENVVVVVTDHTRRTPTYDLFPLVWGKIRSRVSAANVTLVVATGTHRSPTDEELERMLGDLRREFRVVVHDCDGETVHVGTSSQGTPIFLNRTVVEADRIISLGHVGMHYYAGYSGGRKNILPGVAGRETIAMNHARMDDPRSGACIYEGNLINEEMVEAAAMVGLDLVIDVVFGREGRVANVVVGRPDEAHAAARAFWDRFFQVPFQEPGDLVIASAGGHPKDINLYQAYKGQYNAMRTVRDGGILLLVAACPDGIGHPVFEDWIMRSRRPEDVLSIYDREGFTLGGHKALYHARDLKKARIHLLSELDEETVRRFFMEPVHDPEAVVRMATREFGEGCRILVIPHAAEVFPVRCDT